ncbi:MAG: hypothetical protein M1118_15110 [Chloroflexi bacterium]|nr:hypothetical protein [Chloroflexota bacterium]
MRASKPVPESDLDRVLQVVVESAERRIAHLQSWGFGPEHPEVRSARVMFEMQQYVLAVHRRAQGLGRRRPDPRDQ